MNTIIINDILTINLNNKVDTMLGLKWLSIHKTINKKYNDNLNAHILIHNHEGYEDIDKVIQMIINKDYNSLINFKSDNTNIKITPIKK